MTDLPKENIYGHTKKLRFILEHVEALMRARGGPISILDFGCGNGSAVSQFLIREGVSYLGIDNHEPSLDYARRHFAREGAVFAEAIPEGAKFDVIVYADVLEHLDEPAAVLREHVALLADDGIVLGATPNGYGPFENEKRIDRWLHLSAGLGAAARLKRRLVGSRTPGAQAPPYNEESGHVRFFTSRSLRALLEGAGLRITDLRNGAFLGAPLSEQLLLRGEWIARLNSRVADFLPRWAVSTWYFAAVKADR